MPDVTIKQYEARDGTRRAILYLMYGICCLFLYIPIGI